MGNSHHHGPPTDGSATRRALTWALVLNGGFLVVELLGGWYTGSLALLSDAAHMVSDVGALTLALGASLLAMRPPTLDRTYGWIRAETLGAFVNGLALLVACVFIFTEAAERLVGSPPHVEAWPVLVLGVVGLAVNLGSAWHLWRSGGENLNVRGALVHMLSDALGSVGAIFAALFLWLGYPAADAVVSVFIGLLVLWGTWGLLREATRVLLQFAPPGTRGEEIQAALCEIEGMRGVHDLHVWSLDGQRAILSAHLVAEPDRSPDELRHRAEDLLRERFHISHTTFQTESDEGCGHPCCPLLRPDATPPSRPHVH